MTVGGSLKKKLKSQMFCLEKCFAKITSVLAMLGCYGRFLAHVLITPGNRMECNEYYIELRNLSHP